MSWAEKLNNFLRPKNHAETLQRFEGDDGKERILNTLCGNAAVGNDVSIAESIFSSGDLAAFKKGDKVIIEGDAGDDVFYLLSGQVYIVFGKTKATIREAPNQVGEMAAMEPAKMRSATVVAKSEVVVALRIPGPKFREIWKSSRGFSERLQIEMSSRHRERILASQVVRENNSSSWNIISLLIGIFAAFIIWFFVIPGSWSLTAHIALSLSTGIIFTVIILLLNPAFWYRKCFSALVFVLVGLYFYRYFLNFEAEYGISSLKLGITSNAGSKDWFETLLESIPILIGMAICGFLDQRRNRD